MSGIQPNNLSDEELERYAYLQAGALPAEWAEHLSKAFAKSIDVPSRVDDPRQLNLFKLP